MNLHNNKKDNVLNINKPKNRSYVTINAETINYVNDASKNSFEKPRILKTEKRLKNNRNIYKNIMNIELNDVDVQYHGNNISSTLEYKNIKTYDEIINEQNNKNKNLNFKNIFGYKNFNTINTVNTKKNMNKTNFSYGSTEQLENINNNNLHPLNYSDSTKNFFRYNKYNQNNSLINKLLPLKYMNNKIQLNSPSNKINNYTIDSKLYQSPKLNINKLHKNLFPLDLNNNNYEKFHINSIKSYNAISEEKNKERQLSSKPIVKNNIKTLYISEI